MSLVNDNSNMYRGQLHSPTHAEEAYQVFAAIVLSVDWEREVVTLQDLRTNSTIQDVGIFPANANSTESTDVQMPEEGSTYLCVPVQYTKGFMKVALITPIVTDTQRTKDAIGFKLLDITPGYNRRKRGNFRKAYPGQRAVSMSSGYTEKTDIGWDKSTPDLTRDKLDSSRRQWTQLTGRRISYTDSGLEFHGSVSRPNAAGVTPVTLPDGSKDYTVYLQPGAVPKDRYVSGKQDVIALSENVLRVQEYALDFPLPYEILQTALLDTVLGTTANPWQRTTVQTTNGISYDSESFLADQQFDHPISGTPVGPTMGEGVTPQRRGFILESASGTLVGYNLFDTTTYGHVLKPVLSPYTKAGRFGADFESGYNAVTDSVDHVEARLAASAYTLRFPYEYNTTRWDITKEGFTSFEIGATLPMEKIPLAGGYEHPHGAGRSLEGHLVGSLKMVVGKNRDEEDAIDLQALGQTVLRLGADDTSLPDRGRSVLTQTRCKNDSVQKRTLNYWVAPKLAAGDAGDLANKTGAENVSLRIAADGALIARIGARDPNSKRKHLVNGYQDGQGKTQYAVSSSSRIDSHSPGRPTYGSGDNIYAFHDLTQVGKPQVHTPKVNMLPYNWSGQPLANADAHGLSVDLHAVRDMLLRIGSNPASGQSLLLDLAGGLVIAAGKDNQGRSLTGALDGGVELTIGQNQQQRGLRLEINGDVDMLVAGNMHQHVTGDYVLECATFRQITKTDHVVSAQKIIHSAMTRITHEAPDIVHNQGLYISDENS
jgi:hypothetical protein